MSEETHLYDQWSDPTRRSISKKAIRCRTGLPASELFARCNDAGVELVLGHDGLVSVPCPVLLGDQPCVFVRLATKQEHEASREVTGANRPPRYSHYYVVSTD